MPLGAILGHRDLELQRFVSASLFLAADKNEDSDTHAIFIFNFDVRVGVRPLLQLNNDSPRERNLQVPTDHPIDNITLY